MGTKICETFFCSQDGFKVLAVIDAEYNLEPML